MSKILEFLTEKIEGTEKKIFTTMSPEKLMEKSGLKKEEFDKEIKNLLETNKIYYLKTGKEKIAWDGSYSFDEDFSNRKWFVDKEKFNEVSKREKEFENKIKSLEKEKLDAKKEKVKELPENSQKIFNAVNALTNDGTSKGYVSTKEILKETGLNFEEFKNATKILSDNKITYGIKISKTYEIENESRQESSYVYTNSSSVLSRVLKREEIKENINKEKIHLEVKEEKIEKHEDKKKTKISKKKKTKDENER
ncbi:hypothetical protein [Fusobacterium gastrosuis]|uniref:hypothetical protein n=1 Tax=Fusobacterium gastrosuis TaxID=1755100 RepID=UPI002974A8EF|nr:hypothetical protein [Fusobacteriaceae bacterium]MDY5714092.1 hypothetical protein [Fusobacterium gastrosuis]